MTTLLDLFRTPSPEVLAARELANCRLMRLQHQTALALSKHMVAYHDEQIARLSRMVAQEVV